MKKLWIAGTAAALLTAAPLFAQEHTGTDPRGFVTGLGGFATSVGSTTPQLLFEGGVRIAPHTMVFGNIGRYNNLQPDLQPTLDATTSALAANQGLDVTASGTLRSTYGLGGLRVEVPTRSRLSPYVLGGAGVAHLNPSAEFTFASGSLPDGSTPDVGADVTTTLVSEGAFTTPPDSTALIIMFGGGAQVALAPHWVVDAAYRYSRISADTTLNVSALTTNGMTFGFGYRF